LSKNKFVEGPSSTFAQNLYFILKNIGLVSELIKCGSGVVLKLLNKTVQKLSAKLSRETSGFSGGAGGNHLVCFS